MIEFLLRAWLFSTVSILLWACCPSVTAVNAYFHRWNAGLRREGGWEDEQ